VGSIIKEWRDSFRKPAAERVSANISRLIRIGWPGLDGEDERCGLRPPTVTRRRGFGRRRAIARWRRAIRQIIAPFVAPNAWEGRREGRELT
jgi:hypothetical protein